MFDARIFTVTASTEFDANHGVDDTECYNKLYILLWLALTQLDNLI